MVNEKEEQLSELQEMVYDAIRHHEEWVKSQGKDGSKMDLQFKDLNRIEFICDSLEKACFRGCKMGGAYFDAVLREVDFVEVCGENVDFSSLDCGGADFFNAFLPHADFMDANLGMASFKCADLSEAKFEGANLETADFFNANLKNANFIGVRTLEGATFYGADISGAKLSLNDITMEQLGQCLYTPELAQMIQTKYFLMNTGK